MARMPMAFARAVSASIFTPFDQRLRQLVIILVGALLLVSLLSAAVVEWPSLMPRGVWAYMPRNLSVYEPDPDKRTARLTALLVFVTAAYAILVWLTLRGIASQARGQWQASDAAALGNVTQLMSNIDRLIFERPDLKKYFYDPAATLTDAEPYYDQVMTLAEMHVDLFDVVATNIASNRDHNNTDSMWVTARTEWKEWIVQSFADSDALCTYFATSKRAAWYDCSLARWHCEGKARRPQSPGRG